MVYSEVIKQRMNAHPKLRTYWPEAAPRRLPPHSRLNELQRREQPTSGLSTGPALQRRRLTSAPMMLAAADAFDERHKLRASRAEQLYAALCTDETPLPRRPRGTRLFWARLPQRVFSQRRVRRQGRRRSLRVRRGVPRC